MTFNDLPDDFDIEEEDFEEEFEEEFEEDFAPINPSLDTVEGPVIFVMKQGIGEIAIPWEEGMNVQNAVTAARLNVGIGAEMFIDGVKVGMDSLIQENGHLMVVGAVKGG